MSARRARVSCVWRRVSHDRRPLDTLLHVTVSDFHGLKALPAGDPPWYTAGINLGKPASALDYILVELRRFLPFGGRDIYPEKTRINTATGEALFANVVGSERHRPGTTGRVPNLFLAGNFCQTFVDIATVESAVVSGLLAAEEVRRRAGVGAPVRIVKRRRLSRTPAGRVEALVGAVRLRRESVVVVERGAGAFIPGGSGGARPVVVIGAAGARPAAGEPLTDGADRRTPTRSRGRSV